MKSQLTTDAMEIARTLIASDPAWAANGEETLTTTIEQFKPLLYPKGDYISDETWSDTLGFFDQGGLDFLATDPAKFDYANDVDMSSGDSAIAKP